jgi:hypothetical protein
MMKLLCVLALAACVDEHELGSIGDQPAQVPFPQAGSDQSPVATPGPWAITIGGTGVDTASGIALDHHKNVIAVGSFANIVDFGDQVATAGNSTGYGGFVTKRSGRDGAAIWTRTMNTDAHGYADGLGIAVLPDDSVVALVLVQGAVDFGDGHIIDTGDPLFNVDSAIATYDPNGVLVGLTTIEGSPVQMAVAPDGHIAVTTQRMSPGGEFLGGIYVTLLAPDGTQMWTVSGVDPDPTHFGPGASGLAMTETGRVVMAGNFSHDFSLGATTLHTPTPGNGTGFLLELSPAGEVEWTQIFPFEVMSESWAGPLTLGAGGRIIASYGVHDTSGEDGNGRPRFDMRDRQGNLDWSSIAPGGSAVVSALVARDDGTFVVTGASTGLIDFGNGMQPGNVFLASYDATGNFVASSMYGVACQTGEDRQCTATFQQLSPGPDHALAAAGTMDAPLNNGPSIDLGTGPLVVHGGASDAMIAMFVDVP